MASKKQQVIATAKRPSKAVSKSFTPNIVVSRSAEAIEGLFFETAANPSKTTNRRASRRRSLRAIEDLSEQLREDILLSPNTSNELISFESSFPGGGGLKFTTIRLVESQRLLEKFVIPGDGVSNIIQKDFRERNPDLSKLTSEVLTAMKNQRPRYYISFGVGDDLSEWAGPFCVDLIDANLSITADGVREIELGFTPTMESIKIFTNKVFFDNNDTLRRNIDNANSAQVNKLQIRTEMEFDLPEDMALSIPTQLKKQNQDGDRWNYAIRGLIKKFLNQSFKSIKEGNVLVLFPHDLDTPANDANALINVTPSTDSTLGKNFKNKDIVSRYRSRLGEYGISISPLKVLDPESLKDPTKSEIYTEVSIRDKLKSINASLNELRKKYSYYDTKTKVLTLDENKLNKNKADKTNYDNLIASSKKYRDKDAKIAKFAKDKGIIIRKYIDTTLDRVVSMAYTSNPDKNGETKTPFARKIKLGFLEDISTEQEKSSQKLLLLKPLYKFFMKLNEKSGIDWTIFEENNMQTVRLLKEAGLIEDGNAPIVVVGDLNLITSILYGNTEELPKLESTLGYSDNPDEERANWESYLKLKQDNVKDRRGRNTGLTSSFNEEIDFGVYGNDFANRSGVDHLVFMHNLKNSNVLEVSMDSSPYKGELLNLANEPVFKLIDQSVSGNQTVLDNSFEFNFIDFVRNRTTPSLNLESNTTPKQYLDLLGKDREVIYTLIKDPQYASIKLVDFLDLIIFKNERDKNPDNLNLTKPIDNRTSARRNADTVRRINNFIVQVTIKTLPFFNTNYYINRKCLLVGAPNKILGSNVFGSIPPPSIFSNNYSIFGYRHVITSTDAYSEFTLYQEGMSPNSEANMTLGAYFKEQIDAFNKERYDEERANSLTAWDVVKNLFDSFIGGYFR